MNISDFSRAMISTFDLNKCTIRLNPYWFELEFNYHWKVFLLVREDSYELVLDMWQDVRKFQSRWLDGTYMADVKKMKTFLVS